LPTQNPNKDRLMALKNIPTIVITGALGVGKTTLIQKLLADKPDNERWAVLVNEFGEVGIDGALMANQSDEKNVFIKEVPGGCMCCTSGLPMQIALNLLLTEAKPDRLLIEPTGLGHPKEVLQTLASIEYRDVLDVKSTLTLIDARKLADKKWREHQTFREQLCIADTIVVTKSDLYQRDYQNDLTSFFASVGVQSTPVLWSDRDSINTALLNQNSGYINQCIEEQERQHAHAHHEHEYEHHEHGHHHHDASTTISTPNDGVVSVKNQGEGFYSRGWISASDRWFDYSACRQLFNELSVDRLKAVVITEDGIFGFNLANGTVEETELASANDTRIEFITDNEAEADKIAQQIEHALAL